MGDWEDITDGSAMDRGSQEESRWIRVSVGSTLRLGGVWLYPLEPVLHVCSTANISITINGCLASRQRQGVFIQAVAVRARR